MQNKRPSLDRIARFVGLIVPAVGILVLIAFGIFCFHPPVAAPTPTLLAWSQTPPPTHTTTPAATAIPSTTPTSTVTATATSTETPTPTPTSTSTPTPTALPVTVRELASGAPIRAPVSQPGAPCGVVDTFDFPLDPPDGAAAYGGGDFGRFRSRYGLYHAGEDWSFRSSSASLDKPVHSIGHGMVTYAQPLGWGVDQGVVIVQHVLAQGDTILSFYGHLEPDSVVLKAGDCVARGEIVGRIGKPRTSPHLHFEIRTHLPTEPGRGYSEEDPALSGWKPPSAFVWQQRIAASPGVVWTRPHANGETREIGILDENTYLLMHETELAALDVRDGSVRWRHSPSLRPYDALVHPDDRTIYVTSVFGILQALRPLASSTGAHAAGEVLLEAVWEIELEGVVFPDLMPLPGGGVALSTRRAGQGATLIGISPARSELWEEEADLGSSPHWMLAHDRLIVSGIDGNIWMVNQQGATALSTEAGGRLAPAGRNAVLTYDEKGIHRLDLNTPSIDPLYALPGGLPGYGDLAVLRPDAVHLPDVAAPDDSMLSGSDLLVTHRDAGGDSLTALGIDGTLRWRRSYERTLREQHKLLSFDGRAYLVSQMLGLSFAKISVYEIDVQNAELLRIFTGGSRNPTATDTWFAPLGDERLLIHIGGTGMLVLDTQAAHTAVQNQQIGP